MNKIAAWSRTSRSQGIEAWLFRWSEKDDGGNRLRGVGRH
jgi:hypothetical protein